MHTPGFGTNTGSACTLRRSQVMAEHRVLAVSGSDHSFEGQLPKLQKLRKYFGKILWEAMQIRVEGVQVCPLGFNTKYTDGVKPKNYIKCVHFMLRVRACLRVCVFACVCVCVCTWSASASVGYGNKWAWFVDIRVPPQPRKVGSRVQGRPPGR